MNGTIGRLVMLVALLACSRSGTLSGNVSGRTLPNGENPVARIHISVIRPTEAFEHDWAAGLAAFQAELESARAVQQAAAASLEEARLAWDRVLAGGRVGARRRQRPPRMSPREQQAWERLRAAERAMFLADRRAWETALKYDAQADSLLAKHTAQRVQTDGNGHFVLAGLPAGRAFLYTRVIADDQMRVWFVPVVVRPGVQQLDLTETNRGGWPFVQQGPGDPGALRAGV